MTINERITGIYTLVAFVSVCFALGSYYARKSARLTWMAVTQMQAQVSQLRDVVSTWQGVIDGLSQQQRQTLAISQNGRQTAYETSEQVKSVIQSVNTILIKICDILQIPLEHIDANKTHPAAQWNSDGGSPAHSFDGSADTGTFAPNGERQDNSSGLRQT